MINKFLLADGSGESYTFLKLLEMSEICIKETSVMVSLIRFLLNGEGGSVGLVGSLRPVFLEASD
jgi:hypothetical protein